jgi:hypothetical protein|tara:strand:- start:354 stop:854 length:501 start_codon:yes stop_codon:yes gene_type:complete
MSGIVNSEGSRSGVIGITEEADSWHLTADNSSDGDITSNWARRDWYGQIGTGLSESSGIFSFPSTGVWLIHMQGMFTVRSGTDYYDLNLLFTSNDSSYIALATAGGGNATTDISPNNNISIVSMLDVTDITNVKFKWNLSSMANSTLLGDTTFYYTRFIATRLGAT